MIIDCISDLHVHYPKLEGGDLLIVAGDLTASGEPEQYDAFCDWLDCQPYRKKVVIAGNHDNNMFSDGIDCLRACQYLCDSGTEFEGLKIWGSPWTLKFQAQNPHAMAFTVDTEEELAEKWAIIPDDIDILVTHSPALGYYDRLSNGKCVGSPSLTGKIGKIEPMLHVCGHIHECGGLIGDGRLIDKNLPGYFDVNRTIYINASIVNENYEPVNKPIRVIL